MRCALPVNRAFACSGSPLPPPPPTHTWRLLHAGGLNGGGSLTSVGPATAAASSLPWITLLSPLKALGREERRHAQRTLEEAEHRAQDAVVLPIAVAPPAAGPAGRRAPPRRPGRGSASSRRQRRAGGARGSGTAGLAGSTSEDEWPGGDGGEWLDQGSGDPLQLSHAAAASDLAGVTA